MKGLVLFSFAFQSPVAGKDCYEMGRDLAEMKVLFRDAQMNDPSTRGIILERITEWAVNGPKSAEKGIKISLESQGIHPMEILKEPCKSDSEKACVKVVFKEKDSGITDTYSYEIGKGEPTITGVTKDHVDLHLGNRSLSIPRADEEIFHLGEAFSLGSDGDKQAVEKLLSHEITEALKIKINYGNEVWRSRNDNEVSTFFDLDKLELSKIGFSASTSRVSVSLREREVDVTVHKGRSTQATYKFERTAQNDFLPRRVEYSGPRSLSDPQPEINNKVKETILKFQKQFVAKCGSGRPLSRPHQLNGGNN